ncbi:MAG: S-adenosylmethionine-dependent methyltransferase [Isosphaeraceae bacterium]|nr:MAG: S-adenosylmethionine-dependent methyltransferase [Isosphaeraceae bacterium]
MGYDKRQATEEFTRWSRSYDRSILQLLLFRPSHRVLIRRIREHYGARPIRVLDIGCGTGVFAERLRAELPAATVWGVDLVAGMLARGAVRWQALAGHVQPVQGDSERLPFAPGSFDVVTCANSFHHYPRQDKAVCEMRRVLKPGGRLMLIDGYRDAPYGWFIYDVCVAGIEGDVHHCSRKRMRSLFAAAGLESITQRVFRGPAPFLLTEAVAPKVSAIPEPHFAVVEAGKRARAG